MENSYTKIYEMIKEIAGTEDLHKRIEELEKEIKCLKEQKQDKPTDEFFKNLDIHIRKNSK